MSDVDPFLLVGAVLLFVSIVVGHLSARLGLPVLLVFLFIGMLAGEDGPGGIRFDDYGLSFLVGNLALAVILLDGGLRTRLSAFRVGLRPALSLATVGVVLTAALVGLVATWLLKLDWRYGLLMGAIVSSTDAAAVFALLRSSGVRLNDRVASILEIESGANDPMAVFLTITLIEFVQSGAPAPSLGVLLSLVQQAGIGGVAGLVLGLLLTFVAQRVRVPEGLYALLIGSGGVLAFAACNLLGGSGFLAVYLVGLIVGNRPVPVNENGLSAMDGLAWLAQAGMFLLLGLLVTPSRVLSVWGPALALALVLILIARPLAVVVSVAPFRLPAREVAFISWVGLRGAVPIVLALFPIMAGVESARLFFDVAFFVVIVSLLLQGATIGVAARRLGVGVPPVAEPVAREEVGLRDGERIDLVQLVVPFECGLIGERASDLALPGKSRVVALRSGAESISDLSAHSLCEGDRLWVLAPISATDALASAFSPRSETGPFAARTFFGDFILHAEATVADVEETYGVAFAAESERVLTLDEFISHRLRERPVLGDRIDLGSIELTVRAMSGAHVTEVGLKLHPRQREGEADTR